MTWWPQIRRIWIATGSLAGAIFIIWSLLAYRATAEASTALQNGNGITISLDDSVWTFKPITPGDVGMLFFPGALVDPVAYAPLARAVAARGHTVLLVQIPWRAAFGGASGATLPERYMRALRLSADSGGPRIWVVAGHSRGGVVACAVARSLKAGLGGLVLLGTTHPRDFSLAHLTIPVTKVYGTRDTVADWDKQYANRHNLPASTRWVRIDGGNHSQFGSYGFQPGDWPATISRPEQQGITLDAILDTMSAAARKGRP